MRKFFLLAALFVSALGMKAADQVTAKVSGTSLNIGLTNETKYCAFQMDIKLPDGVSATKTAAVANRLNQEGSDTEIGGTKFIVATNVIEGNTLRVIVYNLANAEIAATSGDLLNITLDKEIADPTSVTVDNIKFVDANTLAEAEITKATGEKGGVRGDVTGEGTVDIEDVGIALNISLKLSAYDSRADVTGEGTVDIEDVGIILNISLKLDK